MAYGDAQRVWWPEMVATLRSRWDRAMSWAEIKALRDDVEARLHAIREKRGIRAPSLWCPNCGAVHRAFHPKISIRAVILALGRFEVAGKEEVKALDKEWARYRKRTKLDLYGEASDAGHGKPAAGSLEASREDHSPSGRTPG